MPVVDTSVVLAFMLNEADAEAAEEILAGGDLHAPDILPLELANALVTALRRKRIQADDVRPLLREAAGIPLVLHPALPLLPRAVDIALRHQRRPFDALFVALAEHLEDPLVTGDGPLVRGLADTSLGKWVRTLV
jgi:predicted nucleic acid-binding protein